MLRYEFRGRVVPLERVRGTVKCRWNVTEMVCELCLRNGLMAREFSDFQLSKTFWTFRSRTKFDALTFSNTQTF